MADSPSIEKIQVTDPTIFEEVYGDAGRLSAYYVNCDSSGTDDSFSGLNDMCNNPTSWSVLNRTIKITYEATSCSAAVCYL